LNGKIEVPYRLAWGMSFLKSDVGLKCLI